MFHSPLWENPELEPHLQLESDPASKLILEKQQQEQQQQQQQQIYKSI